jgi:monofunctional glycosyltransferase
MRMRGGHRLYRPVPLDSIAPAVAQAAMVGEDQNFRDHGGIDYHALLQALGYGHTDFSWTSARDVGELLRLLPHVWTRRAAIRGASTITQQLAKNLYLSPSRNPLRKVKEAVTAYRLEAALGKQRILELYLNVVELGDGVWGVEAASRKYYGHSAQDLSREQAAALSGSLPFPLRSNPGYRPARMRWRQELILRRMQGEQIEVPQEVDEATDSATQTAVPAVDSSPPAAPGEEAPLPSPPADSTPASDSAER